MDNVTRTLRHTTFSSPQRESGRTLVGVYTPSGPSPPDSRIQWEKPQDPPQVCRSQAHSIVTAHKTHPSSVQKAQINTLPSARLLPFPTRFSISSVDVDVCGSTKAPWPIGFKLGTSSERGWVCERASRERELRLGYANTEKRTWKARGLVIRL